MQGNAAYTLGAPATATLTIADNDGQNQPPTDITLSNNSIDENLPAGSLVGNLPAIDPNASDKNTFALLPVLDHASFQIFGSQLQSNAVFNYESQTPYTVRVRARILEDSRTTKTLRSM